MSRMCQVHPLCCLGAFGVGEGAGQLTWHCCVFQVAVLNNHEQLVELLLDKGADASIKNEVKLILILIFLEEKKEI